MYIIIRKYYIFFEKSLESVSNIDWSNLFYLYVVL